MAVLPDDVGADLPCRLPPTAQDQHRTGIRQGMALDHEVVLPAYAAQHPPTLQLVGHRGAQQGHGERAVDEARIATLQALEFLMAIQLVDVADGTHVELRQPLLGQLAQALVETAWSEEEAAMDRDPARRGRVQGAGIGLALQLQARVDLAPHDPGIGQGQQAVDEHLAATIEPLGKWLDAALAIDQRLPMIHLQVRQQGTVARVVRLACQQGGGQRIAHGANADLQGAAVAYQGTGMQADAVVLHAHRHVRRGKQRAALFFVDQQVEIPRLDFSIARHVGQVRMDLAEDQDGLPGGAALGDQRQHVQGDIRVATQAQLARPLRIAGHQLGHQVQAGGIDVPGRMAVVAADVVLLRRRAVQQAAGLHEELLDADVGRQAVAVQVGEEVQFGIVAEHPLDEGFEKPPLQAVAQCRAPQAQGGVDSQLAFGQLGDTPVQGIGEPIGFAQPQGHAHVDVLRQAGEHFIHRLLDGTGLQHLTLQEPSVN